MKKYIDKVESLLALYLTHGFLYVMCGAVMFGFLLALFCGIGWLNAGIAIAIAHLPWLIYADHNDWIW